ncbi:hypothetical protein [Leifsonia shinshuensis]|uniref:Uncharacterized protein n=1 Tax=Leifsonia shinshuensis TaxID=150026 RepID=A0A7G6YD00_9MICO|nr:hypothetical protein [Leifsonia shinshuensis]QNE36365.1 hypothetical protein F1C12_15425 [Leifsonia shinshuensis]
MKNTIQNTSGTTRTAFGARRIVIGAASVVAAGALIGVGAQGAFAATGDTGAAGSGSATVSTSTSTTGASASTGGSASFDLGHGFSLFGQAHALFNGHVNGAKAQQLAKKIVADTPVFSLLPDTLQGDLKTLANAASQDRTADAKKLVSTALDGGYGTAIQKLATQLKGDASSDAKQDGDAQGGLDLKGLDVKGLIAGLQSGDLLGSASGTSSKLTTEVDSIASAVTGDSQLASKLPDSLRSDLSQLASAPASAQTADLQHLATTALSGGYGSQVQQVADQIESAVTAAH